MNLHDMLMYAWYVLQKKFRTIRLPERAKNRRTRRAPEPQVGQVEEDGPIRENKPPKPEIERIGRNPADAECKPQPKKPRGKGEDRPIPEIRIWTWEDLSELMDVMEGEGQASMAFDKTMLKDHITGSGLLGLVALREGKIVGFIVASQGMVIHIAVKREDHYTGVGTALWNGLVEAFGEETPMNMRVKIRDDNLPAHLFFKKMGFICPAMVLNSIEGSDDAVYMMMYPPPPAWKIGTLHIIDGNEQWQIYRPYPENRT